MTSSIASSFKAICWLDGKVRLIDQTRLPLEEVWLELADYRQVVAAIKQMRIRGAPAIGVAGAYAVALAALEFAKSPEASFISRLEIAAGEIRQARPTGANLGWAVGRMLEVCRRTTTTEDAVARLITEASRIQDEDEEANRRMGKLGAELISRGSTVLTHCNAGALATGGYGTALGVVRSACADGRVRQVFATETRPLLQGARLTAWELVREQINTTLIPDSAAGQLMYQRKVDVIIVGADRIAANGDVANKIGTYSLAVLAKENSIPFYVAAPTSTVDLGLVTGDLIPLEARTPEEVTSFAGTRTAPAGVQALNSAFDVTPHRYVTAIITEKGIVQAPYERALRQLMGSCDG